MAGTARKDGLRPSILDRLIDDSPGDAGQWRDGKAPDRQRFMSLNEYRNHVRRDLAWLMNTANLKSALNLDDFPEVESSVVNFGMPDISGLTSSTVNANELQKAVKNIIVRFEPRFVQKSLRVRVEVNPDQLNHNALCFVIDGELKADPATVPISLRTELDLETGQVSVAENTR